jgi:hypothetical protein
MRSAALQQRNIFSLIAIYDRSQPVDDQFLLQIIGLIFNSIRIMKKGIQNIDLIHIQF